MLPCWNKRRPPHRPDTAWSWLVCISGTVSTTVMLGHSNSFAVVMPVLLEEFKSTRQSVAWVGSLATSLTFFAAPVTGMFISWLGFRITAAFGTIACAAALIGMSFTKSILQMYFVYGLLFGFGCSFAFISSVLAVTKYFKKQQALALGIVTSGVNIGVLTQGPLLQVLIDKFGWRGMYRILAGIVISTLVLVMSFDPNVSDEVSVSNRQEVVVKEDTISLQEFLDNSQAVHPAPAQSKCSMIGETLKTPMYTIAVLTLFLELFVGGVNYVHLVEYCKELGIPVQDGSKLFIYLGISSLISSIVSGRILDIPAVNPFHLNQAAAIIMATSMLVLQLATEYKHFVIFSVFMGIGLGCCFTTIILLLIVTVRPHLNIVSYPVGEMMISVGGLAGPPTIGLIADIYSTYRPAYYTAGGVMLLAMFIPFLQYCFKPWRQSRSMSKDQSELMVVSEQSQERQARRLANHTI